MWETLELTNWSRLSERPPRSVRRRRDSKKEAKSLFDAYKSGRSRRKQKRLHWWAQKRVRGELNYVLTSTLRFVLISFISLTVVETFIKRRLDAKWWAFEILYFSIAGVIVSLAAWWKNEAN